MKYLKEFINTRDPLLLLYHRGHGGEHIASTLSACCTSFAALPSNYNHVNNRVNARCAIRYIDTGPVDLSFIDPFIDYHVLSSLGRGNILIKDHPVPAVYDFYYEHFPSIKIIFLSPDKEVEYFSKMGCKKWQIKYTVEILTKTTYGRLLIPHC